MAVSSPKYRDYFITINQEAESYENALEIVKELNFKLFAYIVHDKDVLITDEGETKPKATHKHIMVELKNPITFESIRKKFKGAHIEVPKYKKSAYQYLIHNSPNSKEKYQYDLKEIITNNEAEFKEIIESETFELFKENMFIRYIAEGIRTPYQFAKRFGLNAYRQYWTPYNDMLRAINFDEELKRDIQEMQEAIYRELSLPWEVENNEEE